MKFTRFWMKSWVNSEPKISRHLCDTRKECETTGPAAANYTSSTTLPAQRVGAAVTYCWIENDKGNPRPNT